MSSCALAIAAHFRLRRVELAGCAFARNLACDMGKQKSPPPPPPPPPPRAPPPVPPSSPSPLVNDAQHTLRATQTVFGSGADVGGVAPSWSDASVRRSYYVRRDIARCSHRGYSLHTTHAARGTPHPFPPKTPFPRFANAQLCPFELFSFALRACLTRRAIPDQQRP